MSKVSKGQYGYLNKMRTIALLRSLAVYCISFLIMGAGYIYTGKKENIFTVIAVLGILPASHLLVNAIMFLRFKSGNEGSYIALNELIKKYDIPSSLFFFDSVLTIEKGGSYFVNSFACIDGCLIGYTESEKADIKLLEKHIRTMLKNNQISGVNIKLFSREQEQAFIDRADDLFVRFDGTIQEKDLNAMALIVALSL